MSEPFVAEIRIFAGNFAPRSWAFCNGQLLPVSQNTALFSLIGTTYGGDGRTTTALPNLKGRAAMHPGRGPGLTSKRLGQRGGTETVTLSEAQMAAHKHTARGSENVAIATAPENDYVARGGGRGINSYIASNSNIGTFNSMDNTGGSQPHNNMQPFLTMNFIIALQGLYPSRS
jgi:microcystin-dependent protein